MLHRHCHVAAFPQQQGAVSRQNRFWQTAGQWTCSTLHSILGNQQMREPSPPQANNEAIVVDTITRDSALSVLHNRVSAIRVAGPEPDADMLDNIYRAALRAADHAMLRPWRFLVVRGLRREALGELFARHLQQAQPDADDRLLDNARSKALRAPLIIVVISSPKLHPKVPVWEQDLSAGAAAQNMLNAAFAQGLGAIWRTGDVTTCPIVSQGLGLQEGEKLIGFLYLGHPQGPSRPVPKLDPDDYFADWQGPDEH